MHGTKQDRKTEKRARVHRQSIPKDNRSASRHLAAHAVRPVFTHEKGTNGVRCNLFTHDHRGHAYSPRWGGKKDVIGIARICSEESVGICSHNQS